MPQVNTIKGTIASRVLELIALENINKGIGAPFTREDLEKISKIKKYSNPEKKVAYYIREGLKNEVFTARQILNKYKKLGVPSRVLLVEDIIGEAKRYAGKLESLWRKNLLAESSNALSTIRKYNNVLSGLLNNSQAVNVLLKARDRGRLTGQEIYELAKQIIFIILDLERGDPLPYVKGVVEPIIANISEEFGEKYTIVVNASRIKEVAGAVEKSCAYTNIYCSPDFIAFTQGEAYLSGYILDVFYVLKTDVKLPDDIPITLGVPIIDVTRGPDRARLEFKGLLYQGFSKPYERKGALVPLFTQVLLGSSTLEWSIHASKKLIQALKETPRFYVCKKGCITTHNGFIVNPDYELNGEKLLAPSYATGSSSTAEIIMVNNGDSKHGVLKKILPSKIIGDMEIAVKRIDKYGWILLFKNYLGDAVAVPFPGEGNATRYFIPLGQSNSFSSLNPVINDYIRNGEYERLSLDIIPVVNGGIGSLYASGNRLHVIVSNTSVVAMTRNEYNVVEPRRDQWLGSAYGIVKLRSKENRKLKVLINPRISIDTLFEKLVGGDLIVPVSDSCPIVDSSNVCGSQDTSPLFWDARFFQFADNFISTDESEFSFKAPGRRLDITPVVALSDNSLIFYLMKGVADPSDFKYAFLSPSAFKEAVLVEKASITLNSVGDLLRNNDILEVIMAPVSLYPNSRRRLIHGRVVFGFVRNPASNEYLPSILFTISNSISFMYIINISEIVRVVNK